MDPQRARMIREGTPGHGPVVYWMNRDQRVADNWALSYAQDLARERHVPLAVVFTLTAALCSATSRHYEFLLRGLEQTEQSLARYGIPFFLFTGSPEKELPSFVTEHRVGTLVTDFSPLRNHRHWNDGVAKRISIPFVEVDAHNIVPCWVASDRREYAASTFRPKLQRLLPTFLDDAPSLIKKSIPWKNKPSTDWKRVRKHLKLDTAVRPVQWLVPGEEAAQRALHRFVDDQLASYETKRNDPTAHAQSNLSPYLHFGHIAPQRVALEVMKNTRHLTARDAFLEELIVRRELSDNFCLYTPAYDSVEAFPAWASLTLDRHRHDKREHTYTRAQFERGQTHDPLWNAAQLEMTLTGKMHGYLRMFWAKKILEWTGSPEEALRSTIYLNDKYQLDGSDPNGYTGIAWSIGGVHDRAWGERQVFGKIRYMSYDGCRRKFDVDKYIAHIRTLA